MEKAMQLLRDNGYDAYIEYGRLYYRTFEGGVEAVMNENHVHQMIARAHISKDALLV